MASSRATRVGLAAVLVVAAFVVTLRQLGFDLIGLAHRTGWVGLIAAGLVIGYALDLATRPKRRRGR